MLQFDERLKTRLDGRQNRGFHCS